MKDKSDQCKNRAVEKLLRGVNLLVFLFLGQATGIEEGKL